MIYWQFSRNRETRYLIAVLSLILIVLVSLSETTLAARLLMVTGITINAFMIDGLFSATPVAISTDSRLWSCIYPSRILTMTCRSGMLLGPIARLDFEPRENTAATVRIWLIQTNLVMGQHSATWAQLRALVYLMKN